MASSLVFLCLFALCPFVLALPTGEPELLETDSPTTTDLFNSTELNPDSIMDTTNASTEFPVEPEFLNNTTGTSTEPPTTDGIEVETIRYTDQPDIEPTAPEYIKGAASSVSFSSVLVMTLPVLLWFAIKA